MAAETEILRKPRTPNIPQAAVAHVIPFTNNKCGMPNRAKQSLFFMKNLF